MIGVTIGIAFSIPAVTMDVAEAVEPQTEAVQRSDHATHQAAEVVRPDSIEHPKPSMAVDQPGLEAAVGVMVVTAVALIIWFRRRGRRSRHSRAIGFGRQAARSSSSRTTRFELLLRAVFLRVGPHSVASSGDEFEDEHQEEGEVVRTRQRQGRLRQRAAATTVGLMAVVASLLTAPLQATATPAQLAAAEPAAPTPDVLDVAFPGGVPTETTANMTAKTWGAPTYSQDADLGAPIMKVDGVDDAVSFAGFGDQWSKLGTAFSVECVFRIDQALPVSAEKDLCSDKQAGGLSIYVSGSNLTATAYVGGGYKAAAAPIEGQRWYHALAVWDGATYKLYVNGVLASTTAATGALTPPVAGARHFAIGADADVDKVAQFGPPSSYAAAGVFSRAVTAAEAKLLAGQWKTSPAAPKADILDVDFADGTSTDHAQNLAASRFGDPQIVKEDALGKKVGAFNGGSDAISYAFTDQWSKIAGGFSLECTFRFNGVLPTSAENAVCSDKEAGGFATVVSGSNLTFMAYVGGGYKSVSTPLVSGRWYHTLAVWDGSTVKLYVDGVLAGSIAATGTLGKPTGTAPTAFMVGADTTTNAVPQFFAPSTVSKVAVYGKALNASDAVSLNLNGLGDPRDAGVELTSTNPAAGDKLTKAVELVADIKHQGAATGWSYKLDGTSVQPGQLIGGGLKAGAHTLAITATDVFGKPLSWTVGFTSTNIPTGAGTETGQGKGKVTLSAIADASDGGKVTTTFKQAAVSSADGGFQGVVPVLPKTLEFTYSKGEAITGKSTPGGATLASPSTGQTPFQRFDVAVPGFVSGQEIAWSGVVDPERAANLYVWNTSTSAWVSLASARGTADGDTSLIGALRPAHVDNGTVHVMVVGEDPFSDDLSPHDGSANNDKDTFDNPDDYDFSMVHFTDTQYLAEGAAGGTYDDWDGVNEPSDKMTIEEQAAWKRSYLATTEWIKDNADKRKIKFTAHTGDVIENDYYNPLATNSSTGALLYPGLNEQVDKELAFTSGAQGVLDAAGMVNQVIAGNHDNQLGLETGENSRFSKTFSADRYYDLAKQWPGAQKASFHTWDEATNAEGQPATRGKDSQNNYVLFSAGGLDFVSVGLSYGVTADEAQWASDVFARYPDRNGILLTHAYLAPSTNADGRGANFSTDGNRLYQKVVEANPNVFLVLSGHEHGVGTNVKSGIGATVNHDVVELLADYQFYTVTAGELFPGKADASGNIDLNGDGVTDRKATDKLQFGASFMRMLQFDVKRSEVSIDTYSPMLDNFGATEYDDRKRYNGAEDNLKLPVDLSSRSTSFVTDGLSVVTPGDTVIGEDTARSGWAASVTWSGLVKGQAYAWTATSRNAAGDEIGTADQFGGVFVATAPGTDLTAPVIKVPDATIVTEGDPFDPMTGVTATDDTDGDVTANVQVVGSVDTAKPGSYGLTYLAADANGNQSVISRAVTVKAIPVVDKKPTKVASSNAAVTFGQDLTLSAKVTPATATGQITFIHGEEVWCKATIVAGAASCVPTTLPPPGAYAVRAVYAGDATHETSEQAIAVVVKEATSSMRAGSLSVPYGKAGVVDITVGGVTSGIVTLSDGSNVLASGSIADGKVAINLPARSLAPGTHQLTASYAGSNTVGASSIPVIVNVAKASSKTSVSAKRAGNGKAKITVKVSAGAGVKPSGKVTIKVGAKTKKVTLKNGMASVTLKPGKGRRTVTVTYAGDTYAKGSKKITSVVVK